MLKKPTTRLTIEATTDKEREDIKDFALEVKRQEKKIKEVVMGWLREFLKG